MTQKMWHWHQLDHTQIKIAGTSIYLFFSLHFLTGQCSSRYHSTEDKFPTFII